MIWVAVDSIIPQTILNAFGSYQIGFSEASIGDGHPDDGRFQDFVTDWKLEPALIIREQYLRDLTRLVRRGGYNFMEFWGWPEVRYRDDGCGMVYSRVRMMHVMVIAQPRPN